MGETIALVGGPYDGRTMTVPTPPPVLAMEDVTIARYNPDEAPVTSPAPMRRLTYEPVLLGARSMGMWPSRNDAGHLIYRLRPET